jgi:hypothetical protein
MRRSAVPPSRASGALRAAAGIMAGALAGLGLVAVQVAPAAQAASFNYGEVLQKSLWFYEAQRSGPLPADNQVSWRGDSALDDGQDVGLDLTGGWYDAGDHVKFGFPMAYTATMLAWGGIDFADAYAQNGQAAELRRQVRWATDYFVKAHPSANVLYGQVGNGGSDHGWWGPAEVMTMDRPAYKIDASCPGSDLAGETAAAMAAGSMLFEGTDPGYASTLLSHAKQLYSFADSNRGRYSDCIKDAAGYYRSFSGYNDELVWGAIWLYRATGDASYLTKAETLYAQTGPGTGVYQGTHDWDDKTAGSSVLLATLTGKAAYVTAATNNLDWWTVGVNGSKITYSPGGQAWLREWGSLRYVSNAAFLALVYADWTDDSTRRTRYHDFAKRQIDYALGDNPRKASFVVGFGSNPPIDPHHRTAHGSWSNNIAVPTHNRHILYGALVGGPKAANDAYADNREDYTMNEVATDYNAGFTGAVARLAGEYGGEPLADFPVAETPGPEMTVRMGVVAASTGFVEFRVMLTNHSAWPARPLANGSFRYYLTLDGDTTAADVTVSVSNSRCTASPRLTQVSGDVHYATVDCSGLSLVPGTMAGSQQELQLRLASSGTWDSTNDWSYRGVTATSPGAEPADNQNAPLYDGDTLVWGAPPA